MALELRQVYQGSATIYCNVRKGVDGDVWNGSTFEDYADGSVTSYDVALASKGGDLYAVDFPSSISAGTYHIIYYLQAGASPATTDLIIDSETLYWNGSTVDSSPSSDYLTTLTKVKAYLGISGTDQDTFLTSSLGAASRFIEKYLDTKVLAASYTEYLNGKGTCYLTLPNRWVTNVTRVATTPLTVLTIKNTSALSSIQRAYVTLASGSLSLVRVASATTTTNTLSLATYTTLGTLATAIEAVANGWDATVESGYDNLASDDLRSLMYGSAVDGDEAEFEAYVDEIPFMRLNDEWGELGGGPFPRGWMNIQAKYSAGYAAGAIPDDIQQACAALTGAFYRASRQGGGSLKSETIGDYKYENFDLNRVSDGSLKAISFDAFMLLSPHKRVNLL